MRWNLMQGELVRQRTALAPWVVLAIGVALCALMPFVLGYNLAQQHPAGTSDEAPAFVHDYVFSYAGRVGYFAPLLLGVLLIVADIREGAMSKLVTFSGGRLPALGVKTVVVLLFGLVLALALTGANLAAGWLGLRTGFGSGEGLLGADTVLMMGRTLAVFLLWALLGIGLGMLIRSKVFAIVLVFLFVLFIEPTLTVLANENDAFATFGKYLPGSLNWAIVWPVGTELEGPVQASPVDPVPVLAAVACLALYAGAVYALGVLFGLVRRELPM